MKATLPVRATIRTVPPANLAQLEGVPGIDYDAATDSVSFVAEDLRDMYDGLVALVGTATRTYARVLQEQIRQLGLAEQVLSAYGDALTDRWLDVESDRWSPPERGGSDDADRKYHGYR